MKKILYLLVTIFTLSIFRTSVYASSFTLTLDGTSTFNDEVSLDIVISSLTDFEDGFYGLDATLSYDTNKLDLVEITANDDYTVTYDISKSSRFVVLPTEGLANGATVATLTFRKKEALTTGGSTTVSLTNIIGSDGEVDVPIAGTVSKTLTRGNTAISCPTTGIDFGTLTKGFSATDSDAVKQTVRITNTGNTTVTISVANPHLDGPFGTYWFNTTQPIAPEIAPNEAEYIDVILRANESSAFATIPGSYNGNYVFTATNVNDPTDTATISINAIVTIADDILKGDMNKNGKIDLADVILLLRRYLGDDATEEELRIGDMDENGSLGLNDIIELLRTYLYS